MKLKVSKTKLPADFGKALGANPKAKAQWQDLTPVARRDFISWIESAKQAETRSRRVRVACSKLVVGKRRPCCYAIVPMNLYKALGANPKAKAIWSTLMPDAKRDFVDWVESAKDKEENNRRIDKVCAILGSGK